MAETITPPQCGSLAPHHHHHAGKKGQCKIVGQCKRSHPEEEEEQLSADAFVFATPDLPPTSKQDLKATVDHEGLMPPSTMSKRARRSPSSSTAAAAAKPQPLACRKSALSSTTFSRGGAPSRLAGLSGASKRWSGAVWHVVDGEELELCSVSIQIPDVTAEEFPPEGELHVAHLLQRKGLMLGRHVVCRSTLELSDDKGQELCLRNMAMHELVAMVMLHTCALILVPYFDNRGCLKLVSFLLAL